MKKNEHKFRLKKKSKTQVFLTFLLLATILWFISKLSKEYTHTVEVSTNYINLSNDKELENIPTSKLNLVLKTTGFNLLGYTFFDKKVNIDLNKLYKKKNAYYYLTNANLSSLQAQLPPDEFILQVIPDTLFFDFGKLETKLIKINPHYKITYKIGYGLIGAMDILPKTVKISGASEVLKKITSIDTKQVVFDNVSKDFNFIVPLDIPKEYHKINFSTKAIELKGNVEKFTEASLDVPFKIINAPKNSKIETFVNTVLVTFKVSLQNYDKITPSDFKIICDYSKVISLETNFLIPELNEKPNLIDQIKLTPNKIKFLIKKE